jgi:hypothetical protein
VTDQRQFRRIKCRTRCILEISNGDMYQVLLDDISLGGALVQVDCDTHLQVGDRCELMLSSFAVVFPVKRSGQVARLDSGKLGINFLSPIRLSDNLHHDVLSYS